MAEMEEKAKVYVRRVKIRDYLLLALYGTAGLTMALMAPNTVRLLRHIDINFERKRNVSYRMQQALKRLEEKGFVTKKSGPSGLAFTLTPKGERLAANLDRKEHILPRVPKRWDGLWRIVIFDIWERRRPARDRLRAMLHKIGFLRIQNSVWIYPYDCEELIAFIRTELKLGPSVLYLIAQGVERDRGYRKHFKLPLS